MNRDRVKIVSWHEEFENRNWIKRYINFSKSIIHELDRLEGRKRYLFRALKDYEIELLSTHSFTFDLNKIKSIFDSYSDTDNEDEVRFSWDGKISHFEFQAILNLVLTASNITLQLSKSSNQSDFVGYCRENQRKCLIVTDWAFPFGGAEAFFEETTILLRALGFAVDWAVFQIPSKGSYPQNKIVSRRFFTEYQFSNYPDKYALEEIVQTQKPNIIFSQAPFNSILGEISEKLGVILIEGFHFWTGLISLGKSSNRNILENIHEHALAQRDTSIPMHGSQKYLVSEFMQDIYLTLGGVEKFIVIKPLIGLSISKDFRASRQGHVTQFDVSVGKGGHIFCDLVEQLGDRIPFLAVIRDTTETEIKKRLEFLANRFELLVLVGYSELETLVDKSALVIIPSIVDETYSRISVEAVAFGIPVITSTNGNLAKIFDGIGTIPQMNLNEWVRTVSFYYENFDASHDLWERQSKLIHTKNTNSIISLILDAVDSLKLERIGIHSINAPQGLGTLAKVLSNELETLGLDTHIFACQPYKKNLLKMDYWLDLKYPAAERVYISSYQREKVPIFEILRFIDDNSLDVFIFPEVCWTENWERIFEINRLRPNLRIITIPMLETVISKEVHLINYFDLTLFPTRQSKLVLEALDVHNGYFVGFTSPLEDHMKQGVSELRDRLGNIKIKFLHIGGHSPTIRKNSLMIIKEFLVALEKRKDISLTVSLQEVTEEFDTLLLPPEIKIIKKELTDSDIAQLYKDHDVSIQIPTHEGIGIGFYEAISLGTPVITINRKPHSEAISSGLSGWLLPATPFNLPDNSDGVVDAGNLEACSLANLLVSLNEQEIIEVRSRTYNFYLKNYSNAIFRTQLLRGLGSKKIINPRVRTSKTKLREVMYHKSITIFTTFSKRYLVKIIPLSASQKYRIKQFLRLIDQKISKFLK